MYNVGPAHTRLTNDLVKCPDCAQIVRPEYDGCDGDYRCPVCFADLPDYEGED